MPRRILALLCVRNEADRYLQSSLAWNAPWWDELLVFDDQSEDRTARIASQFGTVIVRRDDEPSFLEHEARFRSAAWQHLEEVLIPTEDDWIFVFDADEFLVLEHGRRTLHAAANTAGAMSVAIHVPEVWVIEDRDLYIRTDGFWNDNWNPRFCPYRPEWAFNDRAMGSGSTPSYSANSLKASGTDLIHVGYADPQERQIRYQRYSDHPEGHNPQHIASIIEQPTLTGWTGATPDIWRGER
jgi:glycosyltransferase involved in cell wall biosynthesis